MCGLGGLVLHELDNFVSTMSAMKNLTRGGLWAICHSMVPHEIHFRQETGMLDGRRKKAVFSSVFYRIHVFFLVCESCQPNCRENMPIQVDSVVGIYLRSLLIHFASL